MHMKISTYEGLRFSKHFQQLLKCCPTLDMFGNQVRFGDPANNFRPCSTDCHCVWSILGCSYNYCICCTKDERIVRLSFIALYQRENKSTTRKINKKEQGLGKRKEGQEKTTGKVRRFVKSIMGQAYPYSPYYSLYISQGADKENLFNNQQLLQSVIISFILMTLMCDSRVIL